MNVEDIIILGSGPAGYSAAIYAARGGINPLLITGITVGGQLTTTTTIENWPGGGLELTGDKLVEDMKNHAIDVGARIEYDMIVSVDFKNSPFSLIGDSGKTYKAKSVIIATGAYAKLLGLDSENEYYGRGVSACATCDGFFYRGKKVAVIGGGNTAVEEAIYLSNIASKVNLIVRKDFLKCENILKLRLKGLEELGKVKIYFEHEVDEILGDESGVHSLSIKSKSGSKEIIDLDGVFIAIGHQPNTSLFTNQLELEHGYIKVKGGDSHGQTETSINGIFAAGDVSDSIYRQAITSAGTGCKAALDAIAYLEGIK